MVPYFLSWPKPYSLGSLQSLWLPCNSHCLEDRHYYISFSNYLSCYKKSPCASRFLYGGIGSYPQSSWLSEWSVEKHRDLIIFKSTDYYLVECVWVSSLGVIVYSHIYLNAEADALRFTYSLKNLRQLRRKGAVFLLFFLYLPSGNSLKELHGSPVTEMRLELELPSTNALNFSWGH